MLSLAFIFRNFSSVYAGFFLIKNWLTLGFIVTSRAEKKPKIKQAYLEIMGKLIC